MRVLSFHTTKKCISLELKITRLELEKSELANEIIRMKLERNK